MARDLETDAFPNLYPGSLDNMGQIDFDTTSEHVSSFKGVERLLRRCAHLQLDLEMNADNGRPTLLY